MRWQRVAIPSASVPASVVCSPHNFQAVELCRQQGNGQFPYLLLLSEVGVDLIVQVIQDHRFPVRGSFRLVNVSG